MSETFICQNIIWAEGIYNVIIFIISRSINYHLYFIPSSWTTAIRSLGFKQGSNILEMHEILIVYCFLCLKYFYILLWFSQKIITVEVIILWVFIHSLIILWQLYFVLLYVHQWCMSNECVTHSGSHLQNVSGKTEIWLL